jgi:hypothetical protein
MRTALWILGGLLCASGILTLLFSFGADYGDFSTSLSQAGWDGIGDITTTTKAKYAFACIGLGAPILIALNATAWRKTGGY